MIDDFLFEEFLELHLVHLAICIGVIFVSHFLCFLYMINRNRLELLLILIDFSRLLNYWLFF